MEPVKSIDRSATLSFCQNAPFLAAGSVAGAIDLSFSTSSVLEIFSLDFVSTERDLKPAGGAVQAPERFARLAWAPPGADTSISQYGLLAGGLADGSVCIWNPSRIIGRPAGGDGRGQLLCRLQKHQGAVRGLEFNSFSPNLLASGAADGDLCIWDVATPAQPSLYPAMKGGSPGPQAEITCLAWNRKVQHILGTATSAGAVVVWDLKKQRPVISFRDPAGRRRCSAVAWNPEVATQLVVASDDDASPSLQLWDLRNSVSPLLELHGHAKGVLALSWCPHDASLLLSSAKDNRVIVWDVPSAGIYRELPPRANWCFDAQWAPGTAAGVFAGATFEGEVSVHTLAACRPARLGAEGNGAAPAAPAKAPAWLKRPVGAAFGFGGRLARFANSKRQLPTGQVGETATIEVSQVQTNETVSDISEEFEGVIRSADRDALRALCMQRAAAAAAAEDSETWAFLQTHFEADGKRFLLARLGFADALPAEEGEPSAEPSAAEYDAAAAAAAGGVGALSLEQQQFAAAASGAAAALVGDGSEFFAAPSPQEDGNSFFDNLHTPRDTASPTGGAPGAAAAAAATAAAPTERPVVEGPPGDAEDEIQRALLVGNYAGAVDACLRSGRHADALIAASLVGGDVWMEARKEYMHAHPRPYMRVVHAILGGDWDAFVLSRPPLAWRETLAAVLTAAPYERFAELVASLASCLAAAGAAHPAALCFIASGDVDSAVRLWSRGVGPDAPASLREAAMEKAVVLGLGVDRAGASSALGDLLARHAEALAGNGRLAAAYDLLSLVPGDASTGVAVLKDRIYRSGAAPVAAAAAPPAFPFTPENVAASATGGAAGGYGRAAGYAAAEAKQNGYASYGAAPAGGFAAQQAAYAPPAPQQYQPYQSQQAQQQQQHYGGYAPPQQQHQQAPPPPPQQPAVFQPIAAPPLTAVYHPAPPAGPPKTAPPPTTYHPTSAPPAPPTAYQPQAAQQAAYQPQAAPPPPPVYQQQAAPSPPPVYQHVAPPPGPAMAPPAALAQPAPPPQVYQHAPAAAQQPAPPPPQQAYQPQQAQQVYQPQQATAFHPQMQAVRAMSALSGGLGSPHASVPPSPQQAPPPPPSGPPAGITVAAADTSAVAPELRGVVNSLTGLFAACEAAAGGHPGKRREVDDASRKLGALLWRLNAGEVSPSVAGKLQQLCSALDAGDYATAGHVQVGLTTSDWDECAGWLTALKRLIKARQMGA